MKNLSKHDLFLIIVILVLCCSATSCHHDKQYRIGVSQCSDDDWRSKMNGEINREIMFHPEATVEIRSADDSNEKQIKDLEYFLNNKFDIIVVAPNEAEAITPTIEKIYNKGVPVVVFDRKVNGDKFTVFQGVDNVAIGKQVAEYASNISKPGAKIIELLGLKGSTPAIERHLGFQDKADSLGLNIIASAYGNWTYEGALKAIDSLLNLYKDVDLVYAHNDRMAIAASDVARARGLNYKTIGIDAAPEIGMRAVADSIIDATFLYPTEGYRLINTALDILEGRPYNRVVSLPLSPAVDRSNADILLVQNEALAQETDKITLLKKELDNYWSRHSAQTSLFYASIVILILLVTLLITLLRLFLNHRRHQKILLEQNNQLESQRDELASLNTRLNDATQSKLTFFTNVSHDLRTPLTLISNPVKELSHATNLDDRQRHLVKIACKNINILHRLINQILDFEKNEEGKLNLALSECNVNHMLVDWIESFQSVARDRDLHLSYSIDVAPDYTIAIDVEKIERVFFNLLSNAIKYTPANGKINISCQVYKENLVLSVTDTGKGISVDDLDNIFDRFYQAEKIHPKGSGIGLSLAKAFVELHGGTMQVTSTVNVGSTFTVTIPIKHVDNITPTRELSTITQEDINNEIGVIENIYPVIDSDKPLLLIIDDNADMRALVSQTLGYKYNVINAADGREGLRLAAKYTPDIIICDVMMPVMDGFECCRALKSEISTSHIPVLMLTACSMDSQRVQGYDSGADGYLSKPFDSDVLKSRCESLVNNRRLIKNLWGNDKSTASTPSASNVSISPEGIDDEFYNKALAVMREHISDPDINVDALAGRLGLGRSQFYRKIKALTNYSPVELMRNLRLKQARDLLTTTQKTISEIAYETGFSTPAYFTRCFREAYGETPSDLRDRLGM